MSTDDPTLLPQIELLGQEDKPSHPDNIVIREIDLPKYYIEQTQVVVEPALDSTVIVVYMTGESKDMQLTVPAYNFRTSTGHTVTITSEAGQLRATVV